MLNSLRKIVRTKDQGASAVEYGLLVAGIAVVIIAAVFLLGNSIKGVFQKSASCVSTASNANPTC